MEVELRKSSNHVSPSIPTRGFMYVVSPLAKHTQLSLIEQRTDTLTKRFIKVKGEQSRTSNPRVHVFSATQLDILARIVASFLAVGVLLIPVLILYLGDLSRPSMAAVVACFVLVFMVALSIVVNVTPHDLFIGGVA
jgi:ABC-type multidrug transport system fused ATPase/permease subunit